MSDAAATLRLKGDASGAKRALGEAGTALAGFKKHAGDMARQALATGLGVVGVGSAVAGVNRLMRAGVETLRDYIARNAEATALVAGTREEMRAMTDAMGEAVLGGGNLEVALGTINQVVDRLRGNIADNQEAIQGWVRDGIAKAVEIGGVAVKSFLYLQQAIDLVKLAFAGGKTAVAVFGLAVADLALGLEQGVAKALQAVTDKIAALVSAGAEAARAVGADGLAGMLDRATASIAAGSTQLQEHREEIQALREEMARAAAGAIADFNAAVDETGEQMLTRQALIDDVTRAIGALTTGIQDGTIAEDAHTGAIERNTQARERQIDTLQRFIGAMAGAQSALKANAEQFAKPDTGLDKMVEQRRAVAMKLVEAQQAGLALAEQQLTDHKEKMAAIAQTIGSEIAGAISGIDFKGSAGKIAAQIGVAFLTIGAGLIPLLTAIDPARAALATVGIGVLTAALAKVGGAGGSGGGNVRASNAAPSSGPVIINASASYAGYGDERAATRQLTGQMRNAYDRGELAFLRGR